MERDNRCPRCGVGRLQSWNELSEEEHEMARRLPGSVDYSLDERKARHRWCTCCWYEEVSSSGTLA